MPRIRYKVTLTKDERDWLTELSTKGKHASQTVLNALILLGCDEGSTQQKKLTGEQLAEVLPVSTRKVDRTKKRFVEDGPEAALGKRKPDRDYERKMDGDAEAHLMALSCSKPPAGEVQWSLRLLADKMVELEDVGTISHETVRRTQNAAFVAQMERVLDVYKGHTQPRPDEPWQAGSTRLRV